MKVDADFREESLKDKHSIVYLILMLQGAGIVLPWYAIFVIFDFIDEQYSNVDGASPKFNYPFDYYGFALLFQVLMIVFGSNFSHKLLSAIGTLLTFLVQAVFFIIIQLWSGSTSYIISICFVGFIGITASIYQSVFLGIAGILGAKYINGIMFGNGVAGVAICILRIICLSAYSDSYSDLKNSTWVFMGITLLVLLVAYYSLIPLFSSKFAQFHLQVTENQCLDEKEKEKRSREEGAISKIVRIYKSIWVQAVGEYTCFLFTCCVYPGIAFAKTAELDFLATSWSLVIYTTLFNTSAAIGMYIPRHFKLFSPTTLPIMTLSRAFFIASFICIAKIQGIIFGADWFKIINMLAFGITNGYGSTLHMIYGPQKVEDKDKAIAGYIMSLHLIFGIFSGFLIAQFAFQNIL